MAALIFYMFSFFLLVSGVVVVFARNTVHSVLFLILAFFNAAGLFVLAGAEFLAMILVIVYVGAVAVLFLFVVMMLDLHPRKDIFGFSRDRWVLAKRGIGETVIYLLVWSVGFLGNLMFLSWISPFIIPEGINLFYGNLPAFLGGFAGFESGQAERALSVLIVIGAFLFGRGFAVAVLGFHLLDSLDRLARGLPTSIVVGFCLFAELILVFLSRFSSDGKGLLLAPTSTTVTASQGLSNTHALAPVLYHDYVLAFLISGLILLVAMIGAIVLTGRKRTDVRRQNPAAQIARRKEDTLEICKIKTGEGI